MGKVMSFICTQGKISENLNQKYETIEQHNQFLEGKIVLLLHPQIRGKNKTKNVAFMETREMYSFSAGDWIW